MLNVQVVVVKTGYTFHIVKNETQHEIVNDEYWQKGSWL